MTQIGNECGFLDGNFNPKGVPDPTINGGRGILLGPAERADVIVDFTGIKPGKWSCFTTTRPSPTRAALRSRISTRRAAGTRVRAPRAWGRTLARSCSFVGDPVADGCSPTRLWMLRGNCRVAADAAVARTRDLGLYETIDSYGRLTQNLGTLSEK